MTTLNLTSEQKAYLLTELQSKIKEIIAKQLLKQQFKLENENA